MRGLPPPGRGPSAFPILNQDNTFSVQAASSRCTTAGGKASPMKAAGKTKSVQTGILKTKTAKPRAATGNQEVLAPNAFIGKKERPTESELAAALGAAKPLWEQVVSALMSDCPELVPEWKRSSPKLGWGYRLQLKKRNIVHFSPCN